MKLKQDAYIQNVTKTTHRKFSKSSLQEQDIDGMFPSLLVGIKTKLIA